MVKVCAFVLVFHFQVGESSATSGAPVGNAVALVYQPLLVQIDECRSDRLCRPLVEGESAAGPVAGSAEALGLAVDAVAIVVHPGPYAFDELVASEIVPAQPVGRDLALDDDLGCDARVVGAREIE